MNLNKILLIKVLITIFLFIIVNTGTAQEDLLPDTIRSCQVDSLELTLDTEEIYDTYLWSTGDTTQSTWVFYSGDYSVNVTQGDTVDITDNVFVVIVDAKIVENDTSILCRDTITLHGSSSVFDYIWADSLVFNSIIIDTLGVVDSLEVYPRDTIYYYTKISDPVSFFYCFDSVKVIVEPLMVVDTMIQFRMECKDSVGAKMRVEISGGFPPYNYNWSEGIPTQEDSSIVFKLTDGTKKLIVTDTIGCYIEEDFEVEAFPLPEIELYSDPDSVVYIQKPYVHFSYENVSYDSLLTDTFLLTEFHWDFGDNVTADNVASPNHTYTNTGTYNVLFDYITYYGCPGKDSIDMEVKPVELVFPNAFTPNGDGLNEIFVIYEDDGTNDEENGGVLKSGLDDPVDLSKYYISNTLKVFNRWGQVVFETDNYQNDWDGSRLRDGIYYYILICEGETDSPTYKGSVMILR
ncbi:MAG: hypothetical protein B6D61_01125 [Bacteroidetes bacterium 4484_249]|nr:MAG: hypothetical protein B6D61_01125 [Bacteroidetes bacterium 4484_249]